MYIYIYVAGRPSGQLHLWTPFVSFLQLLGGFKFFPFQPWMIITRDFHVFQGALKARRTSCPAQL